MNRSLWIVSFGVLMTLAGEPASAQTVYQRPQTNPFGQPAFSPYLNLLRRGSAPGINYFGIVRPEQQFNASINSLQRQVATNTSNIAGEEANNNLPFTGHPTQFMNTSHFFQSQGGVGGGRGAAPSRTSFSSGAKSGGAKKP